MSTCPLYLSLLLLTGLLPAGTPLPRLPEKHPCDDIPGNFDAWMAQAKQEAVVIVGGGVAGLNAFKTLAEAGVRDVILLEADDRLGGRVKTYRTAEGVITEEGAEWIHGGTKNIVYNVAEQLGQAAQDIQEDEWDLRFKSITGEPVDESRYPDILNLWDEATENYFVLLPYYNDGYGKYFEDRFPEVWGPGYDSKEGKAWLRYFENLVCDEEGTATWNDISARDADNYEDFGDNHQFTNGYESIVDFLKVNIPSDAVHLSSPVCKVHWDLATHRNASSAAHKVLPEENNALVVTADGTSYLTRIVLMTASIGHLKERHTHLFVPSLPKRKTDILDVMDLGVANKIQIGWPERWWGPKPLYLNLFWTEFVLPNEMSWMYGLWGFLTIRGPWAVMEGFVTGESSLRVEDMPEETVKEHVMYVLRKVMDEHVPEPNFFKRTQWSKNIWTRGSYESYIKVDGYKKGFMNRDPITEPLVNKLGKKTVLFAGEHTNTLRFGTVDGAMASGNREASNIMTLFKIQSKSATVTL
ncbi:peroxisomal N(1)-acetyl-spermine/spermidine oxidase-like [Oratosquilla oratoria]|uniref:peroxisomal N(1)-acetyl-spermine/spermidine oxidase-like n=1 Tax=Oratosquilla oratoria TaxID=337810 RepID=UPI003F75E8A8